MKPKITIIMPFHNEGQEPIKTLNSLYETAPRDLFKVIAIDDGSTEKTTGFEKFPNCKVIINDKRTGSGTAKTQGAYLADTEFIMIIDAHMRFMNDGWMSKMVNALIKYPDRAFCTICLGLSSKNRNVYSQGLASYKGARLLMYEHSGTVAGKSKDFRNIMEPKWGFIPPDRYQDLMHEIPCILGANYGFSTANFKKVRGFEGLESWGSEEPFISMKYWTILDGCWLLPEISIGHIFRNTDPVPFALKHVDIMYNKFYVIKTMIGLKIGNDMIRFVEKNVGAGDALIRIKQNQDKIIEMKKYLHSLMHTSAINYFKKFNIEYKYPKDMK